MKKQILILASLALCFAFTACEKPEPEPEPVTLTFFPRDIVIDLGSTDADVLEFVIASDNSKVSVSGIDYDKAGEQEGTFKTVDVNNKKKVYVKTDKLSGDYEYFMVEYQESFLCKVHQSEIVYNKIIIENFLDLDVNATALVEGDSLTLDTLSVQLGYDYPTVITGKGSFEKLEDGVYQIKDISFTVTYTADDIEVFELIFTKK